MIKSKKEKAKLKGFLIDPYKQEIRRIETENDLDVWRKIMRCQWVDCVCLSRGSDDDENPFDLDLWVDDEGMLAKMPAPRFKLCKGNTAGGDEVQICGYGLIFSSNREGETVSLESNAASAAMFTKFCGLSFEVIDGNPRFEGRDASFIEEKMRVLELELPGSFRYLDRDLF